MKRNGLVFVPREPPKRVILYPVQDSASQQQQQFNGFYTRAKTDLIISNHNETILQSNNNIRLSRPQQPLYNPLNDTLRPTEKSNHDGVVPNASGHSTALTAGQKVQNPYYANPFFRPRIISNQQSTTTTNTTISIPSSPASSTATTDVTVQAIVPSSTQLANRGKQPFYPRIQSPLLFSNGRVLDSETTVISSLAQDDNRQWAQSVAPPHIVRCTVNNERTNGPLKASDMNATNGDAMIRKGSSATDIVVSLMDTSRGTINHGSAPAINLLTRSNGLRDDSTITCQTFTASEQLPGTPPFSSMDVSSTANNNNQNWKKALVANFQKSYRNIPSAKLIYTKRSTTPLQTPGPAINETFNQQQQQKSERTLVTNTISKEPTMQTSEYSPVPSSPKRKSTESLLVPKPDSAHTNNIERSTSFQIQKSTYSNSPTGNKTEEIIKPKEASNSDHIPHVPMSVPSALLIARPPTNLEQQRANITRVMVRRDFVKPLESKPPMPPTTNIRSSITAQSAKADLLTTNNVIRVATISENPNRSYTLQQHQPTTSLTQKSLLSFTSTNSAVKTDRNQQKTNGITTGGMKQSQIGSNNGASTNDESRRQRAEMNAKTTRRAASASVASNYE